jgi:hypothetical protein
MLNKISHDSPPPYRPHQGKYRESDGTIMHGVYLREYKNTFHKLFINNGNCMNKYIYPKIESKFHSPMVNDYNLHLCGGWFFNGIKEFECISRVIEGLKPMGFIVTPDKAIHDYWLDICRKSDLPYNSSVILTASTKYEIGISVNGNFGNVFDLSLLLQDYLNYINTILKCSRANSRSDRVCAEVRKFLLAIRDTNISNYFDFDYANPSSICEYILVGLMLGYPIETTVSILWYLF